jgi:hypothetical protein
VVQEGTAKRAKQAFYKEDGSVIALGGKTGTGDQRFDVYGAGHRLIESRYVNRSATFVFNIGERFFGSMTAYVHGPESAHYDFTSALPVQLLVTLAPSLMPMIEKQETVTVPGLHVTTAAEKAAAAHATAQLADGVATVKPAPDGAPEEEAPAKSEPPKSEAAKPAAEAVKPSTVKPASEAAKPAAAPSKAGAAAAPAKPAKAETPQPKPAAAKPARPRAEAEQQPKADQAPRQAPRQKPAAVEEVLN